VRAEFAVEILIRAPGNAISQSAQERHGVISLVSQSHHRIDAGGMARRDAGDARRDHNQKKCSGYDCGSAGSSDPEELACDQP
jgi:hypothetical protein